MIVLKLYYLKNITQNASPQTSSYYSMGHTWVYPCPELQPRGIRLTLTDSVTKQLILSVVNQPLYTPYLIEAIPIPGVDPEYLTKY